MGAVMAHCADFVLGQLGRLETRLEGAHGGARARRQPERRATRRDAVGRVLVLDARRDGVAVVAAEEDGGAAVHAGDVERVLLVAPSVFDRNLCGHGQICACSRAAADQR